MPGIIMNMQRMLNISALKQIQLCDILRKYNIKVITLHCVCILCYSMMIMLKVLVATIDALGHFYKVKVITLHCVCIVCYLCNDHAYSASRNN